MAALQDQFVQLPHLTWRDIILPVADRSHRFSHEGTDHQIIYRNGVAVEMTGAGARVFQYLLPMREGVTKGPYGGLFSRTLMQFFRAYHDDKSPGILYDPIYGPVLCVPQEWDETTDMGKRDGVDVRVGFKVHTPDDGAQTEASPSLDSLTTDARRLDEEVAVAPWPRQVPPPPATSDPLSVASGVIQQGNWAVTRSRANVHAVAMRMGEVEDAAAEAEKNGAPGMGFVRQDARRARLRATRLAEAPPREVASEAMQITVEASQDIFTLAKSTGMTVQELIQFNPFLARSPKTQRGTRIWVRKRKR